MKTGRLIEVLPEYGWGWFSEPGNRAIAVPDPFTVEIQGATSDQAAFDKLSGEVTEPPAHQFVGFGVVLGRRSTIGDEIHYNVQLTGQGSRQPESRLMERMTVTGFAKLGRLTVTVPSVPIRSD
jgi:hypothetical protein